LKFEVQERSEGFYSFWISFGREVERALELEKEGHVEKREKAWMGYKILRFWSWH
jgi:hypothetical protein